MTRGRPGARARVGSRGVRGDRGARAHGPMIARRGRDLGRRSGAEPHRGPRLAAVLPNRSIPRASVVPVLVYPDVRTAVAWLEAAFGFVEHVKIGEDHRSQLGYGDGAVSRLQALPARLPPRPGEETHAVLVRVDDARAHCEHARAHGAKILMEPTDFEYGERQYEAEDLAGHRWTFSETLRDVAPEEWGGETRAPR